MLLRSSASGRNTASPPPPHPPHHHGRRNLAPTLRLTTLPGVPWCTQPTTLHPFHNLQAENERSFKLLQDYLQQARSPTLGPASRTAYHFRFFLMPQQQLADAEALFSSSDDEDGNAAEHAGSSGGTSAPQFDLVQLVLVPPPPPPAPHTHSSSSGGQTMPLSAGARQGLLKLLRMCGLGDVEAEAEEAAEGVDAAARLTTFLPQAAEVREVLCVGVLPTQAHVSNISTQFAQPIR